MIETIISGIGLGMVLSLMGGPVFFVLIRISIERGFYAGVCLAAGVVLSDIIFVMLVIYGSSSLALGQEYRLPIGLIGSSILFSIGIYYILKKTTSQHKDQLSKRHHIAYFLKGFFMCIFNPAILLYWISVVGGAISITGQFNMKHIVIFFSSILITQFSLDVIKAYYSNKLRYRINNKLISRLNKVAGVLIILLAIKMLFDLMLRDSLI